MNWIQDWRGPRNGFKIGELIDWIQDWRVEMDSSELLKIENQFGLQFAQIRTAQLF